MLRAGLASSNLSWDFSLASRAASFISLNCSANCRGKDEKGTQKNTFLMNCLNMMQFHCKKPFHKHFKSYVLNSFL